MGSHARTKTRPPGLFSSPTILDSESQKDEDNYGERQGEKRGAGVPPTVTEGSSLKRKPQSCLQGALSLGGREAGKPIIPKQGDGSQARGKHEAEETAASGIRKNFPEEPRLSGAT